MRRKKTVPTAVSGPHTLFDFPDALILRLLAGVHPLQAIREFRGLPAGTLAQQLDIELAVLIEIEADRLPLQDEWRLRAAACLDVDPGALVRLIAIPQTGSCHPPKQTDLAPDNQLAPCCEVSRV